MPRADALAVVVGDDDPALRLLCRVNLEGDGCRVLEASSADEVERLVAADHVDVVLLDIHFGKDDGIELARRLRKSHPHLAIAFFTGSVGTLSGETSALADGVVPKPFTLEELSGTVRRLGGA
jgi:CheY-like chemotaxis protein